MAATYNDLFLDIRRVLIRAGTAAASLEARILICFATGKSQEELLRDFNLYTSAETEEQIRALAERRLRGEPVAYIVGEWEFYGIGLDISKDVLIPRADTELLAEQAIALARAAGEGARILDLCAGSGCVGIAAAVNAPKCRVVLADYSEAALRICRQNVRRNELTSRVLCVQADALKAPSPALGDFDVIVCNPPYIPSGEIEKLDPSVRLYEPRPALDGGPDGLLFYRAIIPKWRQALRRGGTLLFEVGIRQAESVRSLLSESGYTEILSLADTQGIERVIRAARKD